MRKPRRKKVKYQAPDLFDYSNSNPFVFDQETYDKLHSEFDLAAVDHRKRLKRWKEREAARAQMAKDLGVTFVPVLTPAKEILQKLTEGSADNPEQ